MRVYVRVYVALPAPHSRTYTRIPFARARRPARTTCRDWRRGPGAVADAPAVVADRRAEGTPRPPGARDGRACDTTARVARVAPRRRALSSRASCERVRAHETHSLARCVARTRAGAETRSRDESPQATRRLATMCPRSDRVAAHLASAFAACARSSRRDRLPRRRRRLRRKRRTCISTPKAWTHMRRPP